MKAWIFQDRKQQAKHGDRCPWSVGWYDPDGKRREKRIGSKSHAEKYRRKLEGELAAGLYQTESRVNWSTVRAEYEANRLAQKRASTRRVVAATLDDFEHICKPVRFSALKTSHIDDFVRARLKSPGKRAKTKVSVATVNRQLRELKAFFRWANKRDYIPRVPDFEMLKEPRKIPRYVTPEDFAKILEACEAATKPAGLPYQPRAWWEGLLVFAYLTGWRIGEILALRRDDVDMEAGTAITRSEDNKGGRDDLVPLHPVIVDHLQRIPSFDPFVFPWKHHERTLWEEFHRIQRAAGIAEPFYGFHDFRRAFATENAASMSGDALQRLMRHTSYSTTQRYIAVAGQLSPAVAKLHVPDCLRTASGG